MVELLDGRMGGRKSQSMERYVKLNVYQVWDEWSEINVRVYVKVHIKA